MRGRRIGTEATVGSVSNVRMDEEDFEGARRSDGICCDPQVFGAGGPV